MKTASTPQTAAHGDEFRDDAQVLHQPRPGSANATARKWLTPEELAPLTQMSTPRALLSLMQTVLGLLAGFSLGVWAWGTVHAWWAIALALIWIGI